MGKRRFERMAASGGESTAPAGAGASALPRVSSKITPQMILLSHQRQCSLAPTNVRHDADRLHRFRRTESDRDLAYLIRTLLRFSAQRERRLSSPTPSATATREKPGSAQSAPTIPAAGCRRRIGCTRALAIGPGSAAMWPCRGPSGALRSTPHSSPSISTVLGAP